MDNMEENMYWQEPKLRLVRVLLGIDLYTVRGLRLFEAHG